MPPWLAFVSFPGSLCHRHLQTALGHQPCLRIFKNHFMYMDILLVCMYVYHSCAWFPRSPEEGVGSPEVESQKVVSSHLGARN